MVVELITAKQLLQQSLRLPTAYTHIQVVLLVGSWAKGTQHLHSDLDLLLLGPHPQAFRTTEWQRVFEWPLVQRYDATYGKVWSRHLLFANGAPLELSFGHTSWLSLPLDAGSLDVLQNGYQVLYDPKQLTHALGSVGLTPSNGPLWPASVDRTEH